MSIYSFSATSTTAAPAMYSGQASPIGSFITTHRFPSCWHDLRLEPKPMDEMLAGTLQSNRRGIAFAEEEETCSSI